MESDTDHLPQARRIPDSNPTHGFYHSDMIMLKSLNPNVLLPRWQGPTQVLLTTRTTVKLQGKPEWIHASRCRPAPPEEESTNASNGPPLP
uniref:Murine leukemia virus integrase C-terminal domain-containing protein n=1 Tax=Gadus morhua TaxID=8049 RepID=A0A8C5D0Q2_GADMO